MVSRLVIESGYTIWTDLAIAYSGVYGTRGEAFSSIFYTFTAFSNNGLILTPFSEESIKLFSPSPHMLQAMGFSFLSGC